MASDLDQPQAYLESCVEGCRGSLSLVAKEKDDVLQGSPGAANAAERMGIGTGDLPLETSPKQGNCLEPNVGLDPLTELIPPPQVTV